MKINAHKTIITAALVMMTTAVTFATGSVSIPHTFTAGQTALANDGNDNFQALADAINGLRAKAIGQYDGSDDFTVSSISVTPGTYFTLNGYTYPVVSRSVISFEEGNNTRYNVVAPASNANGLVITQSHPTNFNNPSDQYQKTTVSGHAALMGLLFSNYETASNVSNSADCRIQIKLDSSTYVMITSGYSGTLSNPITKAEQTNAANVCKALLNYINITTASAT